MKQKELTINICGDFYISAPSPDGNYFSNDILAIFQHSDFNIVNLESPLASNKENKIIKTGPHLSGSRNSIFPLKQIKTDLVTLANNHIMDYGASGLSDTISICQENSIGYVGAGMSLEEAQKPFILERSGTKIAFLNFTENEWSVAQKDKPGANPMNVIENVNQIRKSKELSDFVVVIIHGGHEHYHLPSPRMVSQYRFYAENGASIIISHHSHCISGFEEYKDVPIFYGLGNFLFTKNSKDESWYTGLLLKLRFLKDSKIDYEPIPVRQDRNACSLSTLKNEEKQKVLTDVNNYSSIISNDTLLLKSWESFIIQMSDQYINVFNPMHFIDNRFLTGVLRRTGISRFFIRKNHFKNILNYIRCESHSELSKCIIEKFVQDQMNTKQ